MIKRREFLAIASATCAVTCFPRHSQAQAQERSLNWRSSTIQTVAKSGKQRAPVVTGVSMRPASGELAIVGDDHFISIYDQTTHQFTHHLGDHEDWVRTACYSPRGDALITSGNDRRVLLWNTGIYDRPTRIATHPQAVIDVAFSPDGTKLACVGFERALRVYDVASTRLLMTLECACSDNHAVAFSPDNRLIAAGGRSGKVLVWDAASGRKVAEVPAHRKRVRSIEFNPQGNILSCGEDQTICMTDIAIPEKPMKVARQSAKLFDIKLVDQNLVATAGADNKIHLWRTNDSYYVGALKGHTGTVACLDSNATQLVSGSYDTQVRVWTLQLEDARGDRQTQLNQGWNEKMK